MLTFTRMRTFLALLAIFALAGCAQIERNNLYPQQQEQLDKAMAQPLHFDIPASESTAAWGRAQDYLARYSRLKLQTATNDLLETYNPTDYGEVGYKINRIEGHVSTQFTVDAYTADSNVATLARRDAHLLAYYIAVGEPIDERLVTWCPGTFSLGGAGPICQEQDQVDRLSHNGVKVTQQ